MRSPREVVPSSVGEPGITTGDSMMPLVHGLIMVVCALVLASFFQISIFFFMTFQYFTASDCVNGTFLVQFSLTISKRYRFTAPNCTEVKDGCGKACERLFLKQSTDTVALKPSIGITRNLKEWYQCRQNNDLCPL